MNGELAAFYDALSRRLTSEGRREGGAEAFAMHRALRDPANPAAPPDVTVLNRLVAAAVPEGARVLDAGCGWGGTLFHLARTRNATGLGVTLSGVQAREARAAAARFGLGGRIEFRRADFTRDPLGPGPYDVIIALEAMIHCPDKAAALARLRRWLTPAGRMLIVDDVAAGDRRRRDFRRFAHLWRAPRVPGVGEWRRIFAAAGLRARIRADLTPLVVPRTEEELAPLIAASETSLRAQEPELRRAEEAFLGGYYLERLYRRGAMRYLMFEAWRADGPEPDPNRRAAGL